MIDYPRATPDPSAHFVNGPRGILPTRIEVISTAYATVNEARTALDAARMAVHYLVGQDGAITQLVREEFGLANKGADTFVVHLLGELNDTQVASTIGLVADMVRRHGIKLSGLTLPEGFPRELLTHFLEHGTLPVTPAVEASEESKPRSKKVNASAGPVEPVTEPSDQPSATAVPPVPEA